MNRIVRNLIVAVPLATAALVVAPGVAQANSHNTIIVQPSGGDPKPNHPTGPGGITNPTPGPDQPHDGPGEITDNPHCTHGCGDDVPDDKAGPNPQDEGCFEGCDLPETPVGNTDTDEITTPTRVHAGLVSTSESHGHDLSFVLIGGALVTATGAAYAARARTRRSA